MVYRTQALHQEQADRLANWQFCRVLRLRWMLWLGLPAVILSCSRMPWLWAVLLVALVYSIVLPLLWLRFRRVWRHECTRERGCGFLTVTDAGVMTEDEGLTSFYPWVFFLKATLVGDALVLTMAGNNDRVWNIKDSTPERREALLRFAEEHVGKEMAPPVPPPCSVYGATEMAQPETLAQVLEMGDMMQYLRNTTSLWYRAVLALLSAAFAVVFVLRGIETEWQESQWAIYSAILAFLVYRAIVFLHHPGRYLLQQNLRAFRHEAGAQDSRTTDGRSEFIHRRNGSWIRADYAAMHQVLKGRHVSMAYIQHTYFAYPLGTEPASLPAAAPYIPRRAPLYTVLAGVAVMLAAGAYLLWDCPYWPYSYLIWLLTGN